MNNKIILVAGDPNSVNSELIFKCWKKLNESIKKKIYLLGSYSLILKQCQKLNLPIKIAKVSNINETSDRNILKIIDIKLKFKDPFQVNTRFASQYVKKSLSLAHELCLKNNARGLINCAINKTLLGKTSFGVTEFLGKKCNIKDESEAMLISNSKFSVCPLTTHLDLKMVPKKIKKNIIINKVKTINSWYKKNFKKRPKFAILGLNPHNAELRKNSEEIKVIIPAIQRLKKIGINIKGPLVADTIFINDYKKYDVIIGMYHDQVLTPFKTLFKFNAINITLGLKYLRVSPDHGTAIDIIRKNKANPESLLKCIYFINKFNK
jgi:4-hydroxy-L-threonine phosphate dehydrogenase PdxA